VFGFICAGLAALPFLATQLRPLALVPWTCRGKYAPLTMAAKYGHTEVVSMLIKAGADLDAREPQVQCVLCLFEVVLWTELT
jgi:hypothetical protein